MYCINHYLQLPALFALTLMLGYKTALANGWEHTSIPLETLLEALDDSNPNLRRRAAESLGIRRQTEATDALLERLGKNEPVARVREAIFKALGNIGAPAALDAIDKCLEGETQVTVRAQCAAALGNIKSPEAEQLAQAGSEDAHTTVRLQAIASLGNFSSIAAVETLIELTRASEPAIQQAALLALGRTRAPAATDVLLEALQNSALPEQTLTALQALTQLANPIALDAIQQVYRHSDDDKIKRHALVAMAFTSAAGAQSYFLQSLTDPATQMLGLAVLRQFGDRGQGAAITQQALRACDAVLRLERDEMTRDRNRTTAELELLNAYLRTILRLEPSSGERLYLRAAQPRWVPRASAGDLKIAQGFYRARWQSIYGLGYARSEVAARVVAAALKDPDARIRAVAARSMGVQQRSDRADQIEAMLHDEAAEVRWMAARVLGRLDAKASIAALIKALQDDHAQVRLEAATALGYLKAREARIKLLWLATRDPDPRVSEAARYAATLTR